MEGTADPISGLIKFFESDLFWFLLYFVALYIAVFWFSLVIWVTKDVLERTNSILFQVVSIALVIILNIFGLFIYLLIRPSKTLDEKFLNEFEIEELERRMKICEKCEKEIDSSFDFCPHCGEELKKTCPNCKKRSEEDFDFCPHCGNKKTSNIFHIKFDEEKDEKKKKEKGKSTKKEEIKNKEEK